MEGVYRVMRAKPSPGTTIAVVALVFAIGGGGYAAFGAPEKKTATKFYSANDFRSVRSATGYNSGIGFGSLVCTESDDLSGSAGFALELELPDNAMITKATFYYQDNDPDADLSFSLAGSFISQEEPAGHLGPVEGEGEGIAPEAASSDADPEYKSVDVVPFGGQWAVDNANEDLELHVLFGECGDPSVPLLRVEGASVEYERK